MNRIIFSLIFGICACTSVNFVDAAEGNRYELAPGYTYTFNNGRIDPTVGANCGYTAIMLTRENVAERLRVHRDKLRHEFLDAFAAVTNEYTGEWATEDNFDELYERLIRDHILGQNPNIRFRDRCMTLNLLNLIGLVSGMEVVVENAHNDGMPHTFGDIGRRNGQIHVLYDYTRNHWIGLR